MTIYILNEAKESAISTNGRRHPNGEEAKGRGTTLAATLSTSN